MADRSLSLLVKFAALDRLTGPTRSMLGGTRALSRGIQQTRQELAALRRSEASLGAFRGLENKLRGTSTALEAARQKTAQLRTEIAASESPTKKMAQALARAEREEKKLTERHEAQGSELQTLSRKLEEAGLNVTELARDEDRLSQSVRDATRRLQEQEDQLNSNREARARVDRAFERGQRMRQTGYGMVGAGTTAALPLVASGVSAARFQSTMTDIAQKANITRERAAALGREFDRMAPRVAQLPEDLARGADTLLGMGSSLPDTMNMIEPIGRAATAYHAEVEDLSNAAFATVQNLQVAARDTTRTLDMMATAGKAGAFELRDMAQYFPALTAGANALGMRGTAAVADLSAALQIARRGAGDSASAANNVQNLLNKINTADTVRNFRAMGVDITRQLREGMAQGKSPIEIIAEQAQRATRGDLSRLSYLFGDAQVQAALRPLVQNLADYRRIRAEALAASGTVEADFNDRMRDSAEVYRANMARLSAFAHLVGGALLPTFNAFMTKVGELADRFSSWAQANPQLFATLAKIAAIIAILLIAFGGIAIVIGTILGPFAYLRFMFRGALPVLRLLASGLGWVGRALLLLGRFWLVVALRGIMMFARGIMAAGAMMLANPVVLVVMAIIAAVALLAYLIWKYWDQIKAAFWAVMGWLRPVWNFIVGVVTVAVALFLAPIRAAIWLLRQIWDGICAVFRWAGGVLGGIWNGICAAAGVFARVFMFIFGVIAAPLRVIWGAICAVFEWAKGVLVGIWNGIVAGANWLGGKLRDAWNGIKNFFSADNSVVGAVRRAAERIRAEREGMRGAGVAMMQGLVAGINAQVGAATAAAARAADQTAAAARARLQIRSPSRVFRAMGEHVVDGLAQGIDRRAWSPVERVNSLAQRMTAALAIGAAATSPAAASPAFAGSAGGRGASSYTINVYGAPGQSPQDIAAAVRAELDRRDRQAAAGQLSSYRDDD